MSGTWRSKISKRQKYCSYTSIGQIPYPIFQCHKIASFNWAIVFYECNEYIMLVIWLYNVWIWTTAKNHSAPCKDPEKNYNLFIHDVPNSRILPLFSFSMTWYFKTLALRHFIGLETKYPILFSNLWNCTEKILTLKKFCFKSLNAYKILQELNTIKSFAVFWYSQKWATF